MAKVGLRLAGLALLGLAWWLGSTLLKRYGGSLQHPPLEYLLALITFLCASSGSVLTILGDHVFDRVRIASRWARRSDAAEALHREQTAWPERKRKRKL